MRENAIRPYSNGNLLMMQTKGPKWKGRGANDGFFRILFSRSIISRIFVEQGAACFFARRQDCGKACRCPDADIPLSGDGHRGTPGNLAAAFPAGRNEACHTFKYYQDQNRILRNNYDA